MLFSWVYLYNVIIEWLLSFLWLFSFSARRLSSRKYWFYRQKCRPFWWFFQKNDFFLAIKFINTLNENVSLSTQQRVRTGQQKQGHSGRRPLSSTRLPGWLLLSRPCPMSKPYSSITVFCVSERRSGPQNRPALFWTIHFCFFLGLMIITVGTVSVHSIGGCYLVASRR